MTVQSGSILVVDDEVDFLRSASLSLRIDGFAEVDTAANAAEAMTLIGQKKYSLILLDIMMPDRNGNELLPEIRALQPDVVVIMCTAVNEVESAVGCIRAGAYDYLVKPIDKPRLIASVQKALDYSDLRKTTERLSEHFLNSQSENTEAFKSILTRSDSIKAIFRYIEAIAPTSMTVLVRGETGTGKELFARSIHDAGNRSGQFIAVNVAGLDDTLFSDTLFGHERGAFTGADKKRKGLIAAAENGTLFLDEIGDLRPETQVKLLRLLEDRTYYQVGNDTIQRANCRFVVATSVDLVKAVAEGKFRRDLYYRLKSHTVRIPPLRDHSDDIPLLLEHFLQVASDELGKSAPSIPSNVYQLLKTYSFPGNVRELRGIAFDAASRHKDGMLSIEVFMEHIAAENPEFNFVQTEISDSLLTIGSAFPTLKQAEDFLVEEALRRCNNNQSHAARLLGMTPSALNKRLNRL
jgi:DNA-binding NtrC family response regulator